VMQRIRYFFITLFLLYHHIIISVEMDFYFGLHHHYSVCNVQVFQPVIRLRVSLISRSEPPGDLQPILLFTQSDPTSAGSRFSFPGCLPLSYSFRPVAFNLPLLSSLCRSLWR
jgi:hypothetical protein